MIEKRTKLTRIFSSLISFLLSKKDKKKIIDEIVIKFKNNFVEKILPNKKSKLLIRKKKRMEKIIEYRKGRNFNNCARKSKGIVFIKGYNCGKILKKEFQDLLLKKYRILWRELFLFLIQTSIRNIWK